MMISSASASRVRQAAVAGMFYPGDPAALAREVDAFLGQSAESPLQPGFPKALLVPHAGYVYSGAVAAEAYDRVRPARGIITRVVLLGPCHRVGVRGLALPGAEEFATPLGRIPVDAAAVKSLEGLAQVVEFPATHAQEHSLEVQLPFLQRVLGRFSLVPLVVGSASPAEVAEVLERLWGGPETLIVVSSDLSHYHAYAEACAIDGATLRAITDLDPNIDHEQACGATPVAGLLLAAGNHGLKPQLLDYRNSGDTAGDKKRVVGYASVAFGAGEQAYGNDHGRKLLSLARRSIGAALRLNGEPEIPQDDWLQERRATFITLTLDGELRGCIGMLEATRPLGEDLVANARSAAFSDPRFEPLGAAEFRRCRVEVSILSTAKQLSFSSHDDLIGKLEPSRDGLILECEGSRGTFLPQVWEQLPDPQQFMAHLKHKAGLSPSVPTERCRIARYRALKWSEQAWI